MSKVVLVNVRLSFPDLFEAKKFKSGEGKPRYSANFLIEQDSENNTKIREAIKGAANERWGAKAEAKLEALEGQAGKFCYSDGNLSEYDGYAGMMCLSTHRNEDQGPPKVVTRSKEPLTATDGKPYAGCYVNAVVDIWAQVGDYPGIRCSLGAVQFVSDGEPFAGVPASVEDLPDLSDDLDDDDLV